jgi:hypothetical protein
LPQLIELFVHFDKPSINSALQLTDTLLQLGINEDIQLLRQPKNDLLERANAIFECVGHDTLFSCAFVDNRAPDPIDKSRPIGSFVPGSRVRVLPRSAALQKYLRFRTEPMQRSKLAFCAISRRGLLRESWVHSASARELGFCPQA